MKATLIEFKKKVINIPEWKPFYRTIEVDGIKDFQEELTSANFFGGVKKDWDLLELHTLDRNGNKWTRRYFVNHEDMQDAFPILSAMVRARTRELEKEKNQWMEDFIIVNNKYKRIKSFWFNRLWDWILEQAGAKMALDKSVKT